MSESTTGMEDRRCILFEFPPSLLERILLLMSFDELTKKRLVCRRLNETIGRVLNNGLRFAEQRHSSLAARVKAQLPKRESERRQHALAKHSDILAAVETRLSLLNMTYGKYVSQGQCCFIPGKVLDEVLKILCMVSASLSKADSSALPSDLKPFEILQELRDLSSMAIEHFDEQILPKIRSQNQEFGMPPSTSLLPYTYSFKTGDGFHAPKPQSSANDESRAVSEEMKELFAPLQSFRSRVDSIERVMNARVVLLRNAHAKERRAMTNEMAEQKQEIEDLKRRLTEQEHRFEEFRSELRSLKSLRGSSRRTEPTARTPASLVPMEYQSSSGRLTRSRKRAMAVSSAADIQRTRTSAAKVKREV